MTDGGNIRDLLAVIFGLNKIDYLSIRSCQRSVNRIAVLATKQKNMSEIQRAIEGPKVSSPPRYT